MTTPETGPIDFAPVSSKSEAKRPVVYSIPQTKDKPNISMEKRSQNFQPYVPMHLQPL